MQHTFVRGLDSFPVITKVLGKRKSSKTRKGNKNLRSALTEVAHSQKGANNYLGAQYRWIAAKRGKKRAAIAVAHSILTIAYYVLTRKDEYKELGAHYFEKPQAEAIVRKSIQKLEDLGYIVTLTTPQAA
jgi:transposase